MNSHSFSVLVSEKVVIDLASFSNHHNLGFKPFESPLFNVRNRSLNFAF